MNWTIGNDLTITVYLNISSLDCIRLNQVREWATVSYPQWCWWLDDGGNFKLLVLGHRHRNMWLCYWGPAIWAIRGPYGYIYGQFASLTFSGPEPGSPTLKWKISTFYKEILNENFYLQTYRSLNYRSGQNSPTIPNPAIPIPVILYPMNTFIFDFFRSFSSKFVHVLFKIQEFIDSFDSSIKCDRSRTEIENIGDNKYHRIG